MTDAKKCFQDKGISLAPGRNFGATYEGVALSLEIKNFYALCENFSLAQ